MKKLGCFPKDDSNEEDDADPLDDFFLVAGLNDLELIVADEKSLKNKE